MANQPIFILPEGTERYIKNVLRAYPGMKRELQALRQQSVTVRYNPAGGGSGPGRSTEIGRAHV